MGLPIETTVLRNQSTRKDAAYVVIVRERDGEPGVYSAIGYYGTWRQYLADQAGLSQLRSAPKWSGTSLTRAKQVANGIVAEKQGRSYVLQTKTIGAVPPAQKARKSIVDIIIEADREDEDPETEEAETVPETVPDFAEKYGADSFVSRLRKRATGEL